MSQEESIPSIVIAAGCTTLALGSALAFLIMKKKGKEERNYDEVVVEEEELDTSVRYVLSFLVSVF